MDSSDTETASNMTDQSANVLATEESDDELSHSPSSSSYESSSLNSREGRDPESEDGRRMSTPKPSGRIKLTIRKAEITRDNYTYYIADVVKRVVEETGKRFPLSSDSDEDYANVSFQQQQQQQQPSVPYFPESTDFPEKKDNNVVCEQLNVALEDMLTSVVTPSLDRIGSNYESFNKITPFYEKSQTFLPDLTVAYLDKVLKDSYQTGGLASLGTDSAVSQSLSFNLPSPVDSDILAQSDASNSSSYSSLTSKDSSAISSPLQGQLSDEDIEQDAFLLSRSEVSPVESKDLNTDVNWTRACTCSLQNFVRKCKCCLEKAPCDTIGSSEISGETVTSTMEMDEEVAENARRRSKRDLGLKRNSVHVTSHVLGVREIDQSPKKSSKVTRPNQKDGDQNVSSSVENNSKMEDFGCSCDPYGESKCQNCLQNGPNSEPTKPEAIDAEMQFKHHSLQTLGLEGSPSVGQLATDGDLGKRNLRSRKPKHESPFCTTRRKKPKRLQKPKEDEISTSIWPDDGFEPKPPSLSKQPLKDKELILKTPIMRVVDKKEAYSDDFAQRCMNQPVCVIKDLCRTIGLDLKPFSSKVLKTDHGNHTMDIRIQNKVKQEKSGVDGPRQKWNWKSCPSQLTIAEYARYQAASFMKYKYRKLATKKLSKDVKLKSAKTSSELDKRTCPEKEHQIWFGTNVDLSDKEKWGIQIKELEKLPKFLQVTCPECNILNHIGHDVFGVNTVQLYMKVPGCRTPGHQENNNFCSVNINVGPGRCEWFCVSSKHWSQMAQMCQKRGLDYLKGSWWPDIRDLADRNVPVYYCEQRPGDVIWIGPGTVHWVQSTGWCNNVAWNVGPLINNQYVQALQRYEYNKRVAFKSIVPMTQVSWNLAAASISIADRQLRESLKRTLRLSLKQCRQMKEYVTRKGKDVRFQERLPDELTRYCSHCEVEVYNIVFAAQNQVYCFRCATKSGPELKGFHVLEEYDFDVLTNIYESFVVDQTTSNDSEASEQEEA